MGQRKSWGSLKLSPNHGSALERRHRPRPLSGCFSAIWSLAMEWLLRVYVLPTHCLMNSRRRGHFSFAARQLAKTQLPGRSLGRSSVPLGLRGSGCPLPLSCPSDSGTGSWDLPGDRCPGLAVGNICDSSRSPTPPHCTVLLSPGPPRALGAGAPHGGPGKHTL